jgi:hypothetical protein
VSDRESVVQLGGGGEARAGAQLVHRRCGRRCVCAHRVPWQCVE